MTSSATRFSDALPLVVDAHGGIDSAKQAVLSLAVAGRLVPQLSREGRGHDVLAEIRLQRDGQDIQGRSLNRKRDETASDDQAADPSFEIPGNWCWARLGEIAVKLGAGSTPLGGRSVYKRSGIKFLRSQNVWDSGLRLDDVAFIDPETHQRMEGTHVHPGDLLLNITGASIGRCAVVPDDFDEGNVSQHVAIVRLVDRDLRAFVHLCLISPYFQALIMGVQVGVSREGLSMKRLQDLQVPIPPVMEQKRIVAKVDQLMALCDDLEAKQTKKRDLATQSTRSVLTALTTAETDGDLAHAWHRVAGEFDFIASTAEHLGVLRSTMVELALRGRLTAQKADDETTDDLLARIQEQRAALFEGRRIGRGAAQEHHLEKEAPFAIPPSWRWTSLESLAGHIVDGTHHTPTYVAAGVPFISAKDIRGGRLSFDACKYIPRSEYDDLKKRCLPRPGNVLVSKSGSIGEVALVNTDREFTLFESVALVPVLPSVVASYVLLAVSHSAAGKFGQERQKGVGVRHLHLVDLRQLPVPLPPFAEQKRIVARVAEFMSLLDDLEANLHQQEETATRLAESLAAAVAT